ncbi:hypothetical protein [Photobacterium damselae]|uniref:hypothetical protein n=1 Tax=Photobacterium damselae TaxID=38293 RepID=UPI001EFC900A|nr:hypothetical protein [Photobacterium damselae]MCG9780734.1 hypothetical protein [Photobacterium damselae]
MNMLKDCKCPACNPINRPNFEYIAPRKLTLKERIYKQRMENLAASDRAFEYVQANESRYAEHRVSILAERENGTKVADSRKRVMSIANHYHLLSVDFRKRKINKDNDRIVIDSRDRNNEGLGFGSRGYVSKNKDHDMVYKEYFEPNMASMLYEVSMCNEWLDINERKEQKAFMFENRIYMPFREGREANDSEVSAAVKRLYEQGFMIADPKNDNFRVDELGVVFPVDFGLIFKYDDLTKLNSQLKKEIINDYYKGGCGFIPKDLKRKYEDILIKIDNENDIGRFSNNVNYSSYDRTSSRLNDSFPDIS